MTTITNVARIIIARSFESAKVGNVNIKIEKLIMELEHNGFELKFENGNVMLFDYSKDKTTDHLSIFFFDSNDFLVKTEFFSNGVRF